MLKDKALYGPSLGVYNMAFIAHCNINTSRADTSMINRINRVRRNFELRMKFSHGPRQVKIARWITS